MTVTPKTKNDASSSVRRPSSQWQSFQLLPESYIDRRKTQHAIYAWSSINFLLLIILFGTTTYYWIHGQQTLSERRDLIESAAPIAKVKRMSERLDAENSTRQKWLRYVESTKPDDSVLQTLLSVSQATDASNSNISVQSIEVKVPLEHSAKNPPAWAQGRLQISALAPSAKAADQWLDRLNSRDRIEKADLNAPSGKWHTRLIRISGTPTATRLVP